MKLSKLEIIFRGKGDGSVKRLKTVPNDLHQLRLRNKFKTVNSFVNLNEIQENNCYHSCLVEKVLFNKHIYKAVYYYFKYNLKVKHLNNFFPSLSLKQLHLVSHSIFRKIKYNVFLFLYQLEFSHYKNIYIQQLFLLFVIVRIFKLLNFNMLKSNETNYYTKGKKSVLKTLKKWSNINCLIVGWAKIKNSDIIELLFNDSNTLRKNMKQSIKNDICINLFFATIRGLKKNKLLKTEIINLLVPYLINFQFYDFDKIIIQKNCFYIRYLNHWLIGFKNGSMSDCLKLQKQLLNVSKNNKIKNVQFKLISLNESKNEKIKFLGYNLFLINKSKKLNCIDIKGSFVKIKKNLKNKILNSLGKKWYVIPVTRWMNYSHSGILLRYNWFINYYLQYFSMASNKNELKKILLYIAKHSCALTLSKKYKLKNKKKIFIKYGNQLTDPKTRVSLKYITK